VKLSAFPGAPDRGAPLLGEHTRAVLLERGWTELEVDELAASGSVLAV
jgi:crotonobetainyl-CoA:carnitine CoA-transferase CaiB-like acyl-CoA transferase